MIVCVLDSRVPLCKALSPVATAAGLVIFF